MVNLSIESVNELLDNLHETQQKFIFTEENNEELSLESFSPILKKICEDISVLLDCERVDIWLFNKTKSTLHVEESYDRVAHRNQYKVQFDMTHVPAHFKNITANRTFSVNDLASLPPIPDVELAKKYNCFSAILNATIVLSTGVGGILSCLTEDKREWTPIEKHVVASVADMLGLILDRFHRSEVEKHIYKLAYTDTLTQLDNIHSFDRKVAKKLNSFGQDDSGVFIYFSLDQYTDIQSALGHDAGDEMLKQIAERFLSTIPQNANIARIGFDHFILFLPHTLNNQQFNSIIHQINEQITQPMTIADNEVYITFSYGASFYPEHVADVKAGLQAAQTALKNARQKKSRKAAGIYHTAMLDFMKDTLFSEMNLRKGLDANQFRLYYQPQVICKTGEVYGFEALLRWIHPERGVIYPAKFIELAESTGLITPIGQWVIKKAFAQLAEWDNTAFSNFTISINLSPNHFLHDDLPSYLSECAEMANISPKKLILEITEYVAFENLNAVKLRIKELNALGFIISIDDFGTGYSAFSYLQHLPVQQIKIDKQFIHNIRKEPKNAALVQTIVQLGKSLDLKTIAEGIETIGEWEMLKEMGCDDLQGFYFGKPLPIDSIAALMTNNFEDGKFFLPKNELFDDR